MTAMAAAMAPVSVLLAAKSFKRIGQQHGDCHRTDAARYRRDKRGFFFGCVKVNIAAKLAINPVDAYINGDSAFFQPISFDHFGAAAGGDDDIGTLNNLR